MSRRLGALAALAAVVAAAGALRAEPGPGGRPAAAAAGDTARRAAAAPRDTMLVLREVYAYEGIGRRDPFFALISTSELRPMVGDLVLTSILFDPTGRRSIAVMRDRAGDMQYRVTTGMQLGRMRVTDIRPRTVYFSVQEFGANRRDSLVLVDTTKVRSR